MKVSIICPTFNGSDLLKKSLNAILNQKFDQSYEIIFVDSSSNDGTTEFLNAQSEIHENIHLYKINQSEFEHGKTRNFAISKSSAEFILLLTQDAIPANDYWLATMVDTLENNNIAGVFGRHIAHKNHPKLLHRDIDNHFNKMSKFPIRKIENWDICKNTISLRQTLHFFSNNNSGLRRSVWEKIPFPNVNFGEDQTWAQKIIESGFSIAYQPDSIVYHSHNFSFKNLIKRRATEIQYFKKEFGYNLKTANRKIIPVLFKSFTKDFLWLYKTKQLNQKEIFYSLKKNMSLISF
ncbi:glycosyltransferase [Opitutales bacterium]|nr:glycosyltransferase [Opitutales bacterium]